MSELIIKILNISFILMGAYIVGSFVYWFCCKIFRVLKRINFTEKPFIVRSKTLNFNGQKIKINILSDYSLEFVLGERENE